MPPMIPGHPQIMHPMNPHPMNPHPMNPHPMMMINKPLNMPMIPRPMNQRKPDGRIGVIGTRKNRMICLLSNKIFYLRFN